MAATAQDLNQGDTVSWKYGGGHPKGKVEEVIEGKATVETKSGNEISINGDESNPAVKIKTANGNMAVKPASNIDGISTGERRDSKKKNNSQKSSSSKDQKEDLSEDEKDGQDEDESKNDGEDGVEKASNPKKSGNKRTASEVKKADESEAEADEYVPSKDEAKAADEDEKEAAASEEEVDEKDGEDEEGADEDGAGVGEADGQVVEEPATKKTKTGNEATQKNSKKDPKATRSLPARGAKEEASPMNEDELLKDEELEGEA